MRFTKTTPLLITALTFLASSVIAVIPVQRADAWGLDAPDTGVLRLRYGTDGHTTVIPLKAYFSSPQSNPTMVIYNAEYRPGNISENSCEGSKSVFMHAGSQSWKCNSYNSKTITLPSTQPAPGLPGWYVSDATVSMIPQSGKSFKNDCKGNSNSDGGGCDAKFTVHLNGPSNSVLSVEASTNPDGFDLWGASTYSMKFGPKPGSCGSSQLHNYIGVYDPDSNFTLKLYRLNAAGTSRVQTMGTHNIPKNDHGNYKFYYDFVQGQKYEIELKGVGHGDTIVPYFPFPTVYGQISPAACPPTPIYNNTYPLLKLINGDVLTNGNLLTYSGAGTNLAAFVNASIDGFTTSNNGANGAIPTGGPAGRTNLSFANASGWGGGLGSPYDVRPDFWVGPSAKTFTPPAGSVYNYTQAECDDPAKGLVYVTGDAYITTNIAYPASMTLDTIKPCGVIATGNVYIASSVTQLYGVYAAKQNLYDCAGGSPPAAPTPTFVINNCRNTLTVRGSLMADWRVYLLRVPDSTDGELITYGPETWLQGITGPGTPSPAAGYDALTSLPPVL